MELEFDGFWHSLNLMEESMPKDRKHYTPKEKVAILRRHLLDHLPVSQLCDEHHLLPTLFYRWQ